MSPVDGGGGGECTRVARRFLEASRHIKNDGSLAAPNYGSFLNRVLHPDIDIGRCRCKAADTLHETKGRERGPAATIQWSVVGKLAFDESTMASERLTFVTIGGVNRFGPDFPLDARREPTLR